MVAARWWRGAVIYQLPPPSALSGPDAVLAEIDYAAAQGMDAIWPDAESGITEAALSRARELGLKVVADQIWSHTSDRHPWFLESRRDRINPRHNWFVWADPAANGAPPNNWLSAHGASAWAWEPRRGQFYLHHFRRDQPALNLRDEAVAEAILAETESLLQRRVDCLHLEGIDFLFHDRLLRDNPRPTDEQGRIVSLRAASHHVRDILQPEILPWLGRVRDLVDTYPGTCALGEVSAHPGAWERAMVYTMGQQRLHMAYTPRPLPSRFEWASVQQFIHDIAAEESGWICRRVGQGFAGSDPALRRLRMAFLLTLRGSVSFSRSDAGGLDLARLLAWRRAQSAVLHGALRPLYLSDPLVGFIREHAGERVLAAFNLSASPVELDLADFASVRPCPETGFATEVRNHSARLPAWGTLLATIVPAQEWQEEAALAFA